jgi:hypothetical protein
MKPAYNNNKIYPNTWPLARSTNFGDLDTLFTQESGSVEAQKISSASYGFFRIFLFRYLLTLST